MVEANNDKQNRIYDAWKSSDSEELLWNQIQDNIARISDEHGMYEHFGIDPNTNEICCGSTCPAS
jgi:hypothetical protein